MLTGRPLRMDWQQLLSFGIGCSLTPSLTLLGFINLRICIVANLASSRSSGGQSEPQSSRDDQAMPHTQTPGDRSPVEPGDHRAAAADESDGADLLSASGLNTPELDALEAVLATDADEIGTLLNLPFSSLLARVQDLGFDASVLLEELRAIGLIDADLWLTPVQLNQADFLALTPLQYSEQFPESGAPLVFAVLKAIRLTDDQAQLLATAGGTNLSKSEKWEIGVGVSVGAGYLLPKAGLHLWNRSALFKKWELTVEGENPGTKGAFEKVNEIAYRVDEQGMTVKLTKGKVFNSMSLEFDTYGGRLLHELRSTFPGNVLQRIWNSGFLQRAPKWIKKKLWTSESEAIDDDLRESLIEDSVYSAEEGEAVLVEEGDGRQAAASLDRARNHPYREFEDLLGAMNRRDLDLPEVFQRSKSLKLRSRADSRLELEVQEDLKDNFVSNQDFVQKEEIHLEKQIFENRVGEASSVVAEKVDADVVTVENDAEGFVVKDVDAEVNLVENNVDEKVAAAGEDVETKV